MTKLNHKCDQCEKAFGSAPALRMHKIRKHSGRNWDTSKNFRKVKKRNLRWTRERRKRYMATVKSKRNGALPQAASDPLSDAAKAILLAAKVLRGTMHSLKLPLVMLAALWFVGCGQKKDTVQDWIDCNKRQFAICDGLYSVGSGSHGDCIVNSFQSCLRQQPNP